MQTEDTDPESARLHAEVLRRMSMAERLKFASDLTVFAHELTIAGIRTRMPHATEAQIQEEHYRIVLGRELADEVLADNRRIRARAESGRRSHPRA